MADLTIDLNSWTVKQDIADIPNKILEGAEEAIMQVAQLMSGLAKVHVRVDTGSLRDSIRVERGGQSMHWRQVKVRAGGYVVNPKTGKLVNYAAAVEAKYPYMRPAWNEVQSEAQDIIRRICLEHIKELGSVT